jgi:hypothetical protein
MIKSLFPSKNKKLVARWKKEHEKMVELAHKIIAEYVKNNTKGAKKYLRALSAIAADHLADEEIEFYRILNDPERNDPHTREEIAEFKRSFQGVKPTLMKFLANYSRDDAELDDEFFDTFNSIIKVLADRIEFEETHLYFRMSLG